MKGQNFLCLLFFIKEAAQVYEIKSLEDIFNINFILIYKYKTWGLLV